MKCGVCVVLGGANGAGKICIERCVKYGMKVAFMDINKEAGNALRRRLVEEFGADIFFFHGDVNVEEDREIFGSVIADRYGAIDYFLNNIPFSKMDSKSYAS